MKIQSIQKVIKVGDSLAVTIPAKDARALGIRAGDSVLSSYEPVEESSRKPQKGHMRIDREYEAFKRQYGQTLKNLAGR